MIDVTTAGGGAEGPSSHGSLPPAASGADGSSHGSAAASASASASRAAVAAAASANADAYDASQLRRENDAAAAALLAAAPAGGGAGKGHSRVQALLHLGASGTTNPWWSALGVLLRYRAGERGGALQLARVQARRSAGIGHTPSRPRRAAPPAALARSPLLHARVLAAAARAVAPDPRVPAGHGLLGPGGQAGRRARHLHRGRAAALGGCWAGRGPLH